MCDLASFFLVARILTAVDIVWPSCLTAFAMFISCLAVNDLSRSLRPQSSSFHEASARALVVLGVGGW